MLDRLERCALGNIVVPQPGVQELLAWMLLVPARPVDPAELLEPRVAHPGVHRRQATQLVPHVLGRRTAEVDAETPAELVDDLDVVARLTGRIERLAHALDATLARRDGALPFAPRRRSRQDDVGHLRGLRPEDVLDDEVVEPLEQATSALLIRLRLRRVLADDVERAQRAVLHRLEHLTEVQPGLRRDGRLPPRPTA